VGKVVRGGKVAESTIMLVFEKRDEGNRNGETGKPLTQFGQRREDGGRALG